jgi:hypothetical protein
MRKVEKLVDAVWQEHGQPEGTMTAGLDGEHSQWSWHHYGCAADFRTRYFSTDEAADVATELSSRLGHPYQVVLHAGSHIHVEFDPVAFGIG